MRRCDNCGTYCNSIEYQCPLCGESVEQEESKSISDKKEPIIFRPISGPSRMIMIIATIVVLMSILLWISNSPYIGTWENHNSLSQSLTLYRNSTGKFGNKEIRWQKQNDGSIALIVGRTKIMAELIQNGSLIIHESNQDLTLFRK